MIDLGDIKSCGICGSGMVYIRGRYPGSDKRCVCPTCLAERMDQIKQIADPSYGVAYSPAENETPKPIG